MLRSNFTIGCDPEFFLMKNGQAHSAIGLIGGTKQAPRPLNKAGFSVQEDNVAVEFNIPPAYNADEFVENIQYVMKRIRTRLKGFDISKASAMNFDLDQLMDPKAQEFGCEPDYNAWTKQMNPRPMADDMTLRSAGGHIHIGTKEDPIEVIRAMDLFAGVPSVKLDAEGGRRRALYGGPGAYRLTKFGCEYRTLSNFWIFSKELIEWAYKATAQAIAFVESGETIDEKHAEIIQHCISNGDMKAYEYLRETYSLT